MGKAPFGMAVGAEPAGESATKPEGSARCSASQRKIFLRRGEMGVAEYVPVMVIGATK
ncbi:hypothetical protein [Rhodovulum strictum]|uniref:Uncharacterized protein n=1 Tax=Rhodovulum strictum TaxID=58314 RepID=A0A844BE92_9RHOB|nr:hypothetical protein [Rhodovulum strictum]MRH19615.1 hypothetical protein [Rhodovulum strictum]